GHRARGEGRHGLERDQACHARDWRRSAGPALREPGRPHQGRPARKAVYLPRIGDFFTSFEDAWSFFLTRQEPLERFYDQFPTDEHAVLEGWIVEPSQEVKAAAAGVQESLRRFDWIELVPEHFLHVWPAGSGRPGEAPQRWPALPPFEPAYLPPTCCHATVVSDVTQPVRQPGARIGNE